MRKLLHSKRLLGFLPIFLANFLFSFHYNAVVYVNSSYLEHFFSRSFVSILFIVGSLANLLLFFCAPKILRSIGNRRFFVYLLLGEIIGISGLALSHSPFLIAAAFIVYQCIAMAAFYSLDIFLEDKTKEGEMGSVRGVFLTLMNVTLIFSPLLISLLAPDGNFQNVYLASILFLMPVIFLAFFSFRTFTDGKQREHVSLPLKHFWQTKNIRRVTFVRFTLDFFYAFMVVYMPVYLHEVMHFSWSTIGMMFAFMLLPFILLEIPAGKLADSLWGEKEMMTFGLFIMGTTLLIMPFLHEGDIFEWTLVLFFSRVGASLTEVMTETYFFKKVDKSDTGLISIFRMVWPIAFIVGPVICTLSLHFFPFSMLFVVIACVVLKAMDSSMSLQDTL